MPLTIVVPPAYECVSRTQAKNHLRVSGTDDDDLIDALIATARDHVETFTRRALVQRTYDFTLDAFPQVIELPYGPVREVTSITYTDAGGDSQTLSTALYQVDLRSVPPRIRPAYGSSWPSTRGQMNDVVVRYVAGFVSPFTADDGTDILTAAGHGLAEGGATRLSTGGTLPTGLAAATVYYARDITSTTLKLAQTSDGSAIDITAAGTAPNFIGEVPAAIRQAMLLMIAHLYEHREAAVEGQHGELPMGVDSLLQPWRVVRF